MDHQQLFDVVESDSKQYVSVSIHGQQYYSYLLLTTIMVIDLCPAHSQSLHSAGLRYIIGQVTAGLFYCHSVKSVTRYLSQAIVRNTDSQSPVTGNGPAHQLSFHSTRRNPSDKP
jgi:hypothetical protein